MKLETALALVMAECDRAEKIHPVWPRDHIHQAAIIAEEAGECLQAALNHREGKVSKQPMITEAVHTAATAIRFLKNIEVDDAND
jgi:hypothetical protein